PTGPRSLPDGPAAWAAPLPISTKAPISATAAARAISLEPMSVPPSPFNPGERPDTPVPGTETTNCERSHGGVRKLTAPAIGFRAMPPDWLAPPELRVGLGCMRLSTDADRDPERAVATIAAAVDAGITIFDPARAYSHDADELGHN